LVFLSGEAKKLEIFRVFLRFRGMNLNSATATTEGFRVKRSIRKRLENRKRRIEWRLARRRKRKAKKTGCGRPVLDAGPAKYDLSQRTWGCAYPVAGKTSDFPHRLAAMRFPKRQTVFDDGEIRATMESR
jgi:hypothetical protein